MANEACPNDVPETSKPVISKRAEMVRDWEDFLLKYLALCNSDEYDPQTNPQGYINLGTAVNDMCHDIIYPRITSDEVWKCDTILLQYHEVHGIFRLRKALADLMTEMLKTYRPVNPDDLFCTVGVTSSIDLLAHCIADPGDVILAPTPIYGRIYTNLIQRSLVEMWPIPIISEHSNETQPQLTLEKVKDSYLKAQQNGKNVRGIILLNPINPLGDVHSPELMKSILEFCHEQEIHAMVDEVYALTVYEEHSGFQSVLSFSDLPDPERTHMFYGLSKDFGLGGLRIGAIHTKCSSLQKCLMQLSNFQNIPFPVMAIAARLIEDLDWCRNFVSVNRKRLKSKFNYCRQRLEKIGVPVHDSKATFFLWVNLREKCKISTFQEEMSFFHRLIESFHLYIVPGKELFCAQPGWFRISFPVKPDHLDAALDRLEAALEGNTFEYSSPLHSALDCLQAALKGKSTFEYSSALHRKQCPDEAETDTSDLECLVKTLRIQLKESDWLSENTADKWIMEKQELENIFHGKNFSMQ